MQLTYHSPPYKGNSPHCLTELDTMFATLLLYIKQI